MSRNKTSGSRVVTAKPLSETPPTPITVDENEPLDKSTALVLAGDPLAVAAEVERRNPGCYLCDGPGEIGRLVLLTDDLIAGTLLCRPCVPKRDELHMLVLAAVALLGLPDEVAA